MNDTVQQGQGNDPQETSRIKNTPGMRLRNLRNERGLSQTQVAEALHLTVHYVNALEMDEYQKLPGRIFVKGYFRTYAQLLGTDADVIIKCFDELCELREDYQTQPEAGPRRRKGRSHDHGRFWMIVAGLLVVAAVFASWWFWGRPRQAQAAAPVIVQDYISAAEAGPGRAEAGLPPTAAQEITVQNQITADTVVLESRSQEATRTAQPDIGGELSGNVPGDTDTPVENPASSNASVVPSAVPDGVTESQPRPVVSRLEG